MSTLFLRQLYRCPVINYFEYFYRIVNSDIDFRKDLPPCSTMDRLRALARNAAILLDLENCNAGYCPTNWQRSRFPEIVQSKLTTIFDGIETELWRPLEDARLPIEGLPIPDDVRVVTYVSRGLEAMRGFDLFMKAAKRICDRRSDVIFLVIGEDRVAYGGDQRFTKSESFKQWVLSQDQYDLTRIRFVGRIPPPHLARVFNRTDLHIYLTVPFVLSWSLMNALACGTTVLASDTPPVREMIRHGENGLLFNFFDVESLVEQACQVLDDPAEFKPLGQAGIEMIRSQYSLDVCLPRMVSLYERVLNA